MRARCGFVLLIAVCAAAPAAHADTIRVAKGGTDDLDCGRAGNPPCATISYAVLPDYPTDADDGDTIVIGPGSFQEEVSTSLRLNFVGAGSGSLGPFDATRNTRILSNDVEAPALRMRAGGTVRSLRLEGDETSANAGASLQLDPTVANPAYSITDTALVAGELGRAVRMDGYDASGVMNVDIVRSRFAGPEDTRGITVSDNGGAVPKVTVADSVVTSPLQAFEVYGKASVVLRRSLIDGDDSALASQGDVDADRTTFRSRGAAVELLGRGYETQRVRIANSLAVVDSPEQESFDTEAAIAVNAADDATAQVIRLTLLGSTAIARGPVDGGLLAIDDGSGDSAVADLRGSVVVAPGADLATFGPEASITASRSAFAARTGNAPAPGTGTNVGGDPVLGADLRPLAGSPLIDRGDPATGPVDLAGVPRGGSPDIGAYEFVAPAVVNFAPALTGASMTNKTFAPVAKGGKFTAAQKKRRKRRVKRGTTFRFTLSEAATVSIRVERKLSGRRVTRKGKRRCVKRTRKNRKRRRCAYYKRAGTITSREAAGRQSVRFSGRFRGRALKRGSYRALVTARDAGGLVSRRRTLRFRIVKP